MTESLAAALKKPAPARQPYYILSEGSKKIVSFKNSSHNDFAMAIQRVAWDIFGRYSASSNALRFELDTLVVNTTALEIGMAGEGYGVDTCPQMKQLSDELHQRMVELKKHADRRVAQGRVEFFDIPLVFPSGTEIITTTSNGDEIGGIVKTVKYEKTWMGMVYYAISMMVVSNVTGMLSQCVFQTAVPYFEGMKEFEELPFHKITPKEKERLTRRGEMFAHATQGDAKYLQYEGQLTRSSWWSSNNYRADGRVMIDIKTFSQVDSNGLVNEKGNCGLKNIRDDYVRDEGGNGEKVEFEMSKDDLWRTFPYVYGFSFRAKTWGRMRVSGLSEIKWSDRAYDDHLVLPSNEKEMIRALVEYSGDAFTDIVEGKGGGSIFLLHGPPGQGKTVTAETVAELLHKPLYTVSVGELGVTPDELENRLRTILDIATVWNAVILLDEADIYLEARDEHDIVRNAMVGVFLRLLEYHQGVLFLTTNRVKNIDKAFYSRISVALHFGASDIAKREKIWENLLSAAKLKDIDHKSLAVADINGRQIKNAIRLSQTLALAKKKPVDTNLLRHVISLMTNFEDEVRDHNKV